jgi:sugar lactone lactonase YvrE
MVVSRDGGTLVLAETYAGRLLAYPRHADGTLGEPRTIATVESGVADGLVDDERGDYWVGAGDAFRRIDATGRCVEAVAVPGYRAIACALGGDDRRTLFMAASDMSMVSFARGKSVGVIAACRVETPGRP